MKKIVGILVVMALASLTGCATEGYVRSQVDPLAERISKLEATISKLSGMTDADRAAIKQTNDKAQQALELSSRVAVEVKKADVDVKKAEAAAMRAEKASNEAEKAAKEAQRAEKKSEKIFRIEQKK
jgi:outer membrane murein-binding lipoprotein Lpp